MESLLTVHYETTRISFQSRDSDSLLDFEYGQSRSMTCKI